MATTSSTRPGNPAATTFKLIHGDDIRRWTPPEPVDFQALRAKAAELFGLPAEQSSLKFQDPDGDQVTLACESDLAELYMLNLSIVRVSVTVPSAAAKRAPANQDEGDAPPKKLRNSDSEDEPLKWGPRRMTKFLANLKVDLAAMSRDKRPSVAKVVNKLARADKHADDKGLAQVVACLSEAAADGGPKRELLQLLATQPAEIGVEGDGLAPAQVLVMRALGAPAPPAWAPAALSDDDSETEDGKWRPKKLDKYLARLEKWLAVVGEKPGSVNKVARMLANGSRKVADADSAAKILACLQQGCEANPEAKAMLTKLATEPATLASPGLPTLARSLALRAVGGEAEVVRLLQHAPPPEGSDDAMEGVEAGGKWSPERVDKFLGRVTDELMAVSEESPASFQLVRMLTRGAHHADLEGKGRIVSSLQATAQAHPPAAALLTKLASSPAELGLPRAVPHPARELAAMAMDLPVPAPETAGDLPPEGRWRGACGGRGRGQGRGRFGGPGGRGVGLGGPRWRGGPGKDEAKPQVRLVGDVTVPDGTRLSPGQAFTKVWRVRNSGDLPWDPNGAGLVLLHVGGDKMGVAASATPQCVVTGPPPEGSTVELSVDLVAPDAPGRYEAFFRMARNGEPHFRFGQRVWVRVMVVEPEASSKPLEDMDTAQVTEEVAGLKLVPNQPQDLDTGDWVDVLGSKPPAV